jgi:chaperonin cofactor prefoldin
MSFKTKLTEALETILEDARKSSEDAPVYQKAFTGISEQTSDKKIQELHTLISNLSVKVSTLIDRVELLNEQVVNCSTLAEELMYTIDQFEEKTDNAPKLTVHSVEKKYGLN